MLVWISIVISALALMVSLANSIRTWHRDRSDLQVSIFYDPETGLGTSFRVHTLNRGRRIVRIKSVALLVESGKSISYSEIGKSVIVPTLLPRTLEEQECEDFLFPVFAFRDHISSPLEIKQAEVRDTTGHRYSVRPSSKLRRQISAHWSENGWFGVQEPPHLAEVI